MEMVDPLVGAKRLVGPRISGQSKIINGEVALLLFPTVRN